MRQLLILSLLLPSICLAKTEAECLKDLDARMPKQYKGMEFAKYIMICNVKLMEGFRIYLNGGKYVDRKIRQMYPCKTDEGIDCPVSELEKADRLFEYNKCEEIAHALAEHMKSCKSESILGQEKHGKPKQ